ncbi:hypothetical protein ACO02O_07861 [Dirofilaria immitis]
MEQNKNYKNGKGANESPNTVPAKASDNGIRETYMMRYAKKAKKTSSTENRRSRSRIRRKPEIDELVLLKADFPRNTYE